MEKKHKILIIDDDSSIRNFLQLSLGDSDYTVTVAENGQKGILSINSDKPDLVILDLDLPDKPGDEILQFIKTNYELPVIMLTVEDNDNVKVRLLDAGADDYLTKPFSIQELLARLRVAFRHYLYSYEETILKTGNLEIDFIRRVVKKNNKEIKLTATEYEIFSYLAKNIDKVVTQEELLKQVWGANVSGQSHYLRIYIAQLRKKLEDKPSQPKLIITEIGVGHRLLRL